METFDQKWGGAELNGVKQEARAEMGELIVDLAVWRLSGPVTAQSLDLLDLSTYIMTAGKMN